MLLSTETVKYIENAIRTCRATQSDDLIIDKDGARGGDQQNGIIMFTDTPPTNLEFTSFATTDLTVLVRRLNVFSGLDSAMEIDADVGDDGECKKLKFIHGRSSIEFRCLSMKMMKTKYPKGLKLETLMSYSIDPEVTKALAKASAALGTSSVQLEAKNGSLQLVMVSDAGERYESVLSDLSMAIKDGLDKNTFTFSATYSIKTLIPMLRLFNDGAFPLGVMERDFVRLVLNGFNIVLTPDLDI